MQRAIDEGKEGWGRVSPNPLVGCVVLDASGNLISAGYHAKYGGPHAEVTALQKLNPKELIGAHVVVTLEPCAHEGKTPACASMLAKLPIQSVTYAVQDPNPLVAGKGAAILKAAGKDVVHLSSYEKEARELAEIFLYGMETQKTFVALKVAMTEDQAIAYKDSKEALWLTNEVSVLYVHYLRAQYDAILVGKNTILKDNPKLNIRHPDFTDKKNKVIVLDPKGELINRKDLNIFRYHHADDVLFVCESQTGASVMNIPLDSRTGFFDLNILMEKLYSLGIKSVFVEGGAATYKSFLQQNIPQRIYIFKTTHRLFEEGLHWNQGYMGVENLPLTQLTSKELGDNLFLTGVYVK